MASISTGAVPGQMACKATTHGADWPESAAGSAR
jgi:hypothetical protein